jgi:probable phosphoglycerate mutase
MSLWFLRHGESETNAQGIFAGSGIDSPLTLVGRRQALEAALLLPSEISWIISSPLRRAFDTASLVRDALKLEVTIEVDNRVTEWDMGLMSGTPVRDINFEEMVSAYSAEDPRAFSQRVSLAITDLERRDGVGLLVSHGGVARAYVARREGFTPDEMGKVFVAENGVPFKLL